MRASHRHVTVRVTFHVTVALHRPYPSMDPSPRRAKVEKEARVAEPTRRNEPVLDPELFEDEPQRIVVQALARARRPQPVVRLRGEVVDSDPAGDCIESDESLRRGSSSFHRSALVLRGWNHTRSMAPMPSMALARTASQSSSSSPRS